MSHNILPAFKAGLPAARVDAALREAVAVLDGAQECAVLWFAEVARRGLYRDLGHATLELYATKRLGFSRNRYYQFARLAQDLERLPRLKSSLASGELGWTKAQQVARVATPESEDLWIARATAVGRRELEDEVKRARAKARRRPAASVSAQLDFGDAAASATLPAAADPPTTIALRYDALRLARFEALMERVKKLRLVPAHATREDVLLAGLAALVAEPADQASDAAEPTGPQPCGDATAAPTRIENLRRRKSTPSSHAGVQIIVRKCPVCGEVAVVTRTGDHLLDTAQAKALDCDADVRQDDGPNRATIPPAVRAAVLARDHHRCTTSGCGETRFLEVHHRRARQQGGSNRPENLVTLCGRCHRFAHERHLGAGPGG